MYPNDFRRRGAPAGGQVHVYCSPYHRTRVAHDGRFHAIVIPDALRVFFTFRTSFNYSVFRSRAPSSGPAVGQARFELATPRLSSVCSHQLSYWPIAIGPSRPNSGDARRQKVRLTGMDSGSRPETSLQKGGDPTAGSPTVTLLRLHPSYQSLFRRLPHEVGAPTSRATDSHGVTGGVYKARERIHRSLLICDY